MGRRPNLILASIVAGIVVASGCTPPPKGLAGGAGDAAGEDADGAPGCRRSAPVLVGTVVNVRDLGGIPVGQGRSVACGTLFRGAPLAGLTDAGCAAVAALGIETVIDLRTDDERAGVPDDACVAARLVPVPMPIPYDVSPDEYLADFDTGPSIALVFQTLGDATNYPLYIHCTYGRDRTGVVAAAILLALGASRDDVMTEYKLSAAVGVYPNSLAAVLDEIDAEGGIDAALNARGVSDADLTALRARAVIAP